MGSNNSRLNAHGAEALPAKIRPLLRRRIEEMRKHKSGATLLGGEEERTLSQKQLLNYDDGKSQSSSDEIETVEDNNASSLHAKRVEKLSKVVPLPVSEEKTNELCNDHGAEKGKDVEKKGEVELITEKVPLTENKHEDTGGEHGGNKDDGSDNDDEEDEGEDDTGRLIGPGSPSFKIYCIEANNKKEEELDADENQTNVALQKSPSANSVESVASAAGNSGNLNEPVEIQSASPKRKGNKKKKFGAMKKNLLNVKHINMNRMNPMLACTGNDRRSLLER